MNPKRWHEMRELWDTRKRNFRRLFFNAHHRRWSCAAFMFMPATDPAGAHKRAFDIFWRGSQNLDPDKRTIIATVFPDGSFIFPLQHRNVSSSINHLLGWLTDGKLAIKINRSVMTNADHILFPAHTYFWKPEGESVYIGPDGKEVSFEEGRAAMRDKTKWHHVKGGFIMNTDGTITSFQPILHRKWIPEKKKAYRQRRRQYLLQAISRVKLGAYDELIETLGKANQTSAFAQAYTEACKARNELEAHLSEMDPEDPKTSDLFATAAAVRSWRRAAKDRERLENGVRTVMSTSAEKLRQDTGAVIYS